MPNQLTMYFTYLLPQRPKPTPICKLTQKPVRCASFAPNPRYSKSLTGYSMSPARWRVVTLMIFYILSYPKRRNRNFPARRNASAVFRQRSSPRLFTTHLKRTQTNFRTPPRTYSSEPPLPQLTRRKAPRNLGTNIRRAPLFSLPGGFNRPC